MAIVKPIKVRVGNLTGLRGVLNYIKADFKTKDGVLVFGKDCIPEKAFEQMLITKKAFHKDTGRQYAHFVQRFFAMNSPDNPQQYENAFQQRFSSADLEGRSYLEIQEILAERKFREMLAKQSKELQARIAAEQAQSAMLTSSIAGPFDEFEDWMQDRKLQQKMLNCGN